MPNTEVGAPVTAIDEEDDLLTYSLLNANTASVPFKIGEGNGQLTTTAALDYEDRKVYTVTVYASDRKAADDEPVAANVDDHDAFVRITVNVKDVDDETTNRPPVFVTTDSTYEVAENQAAGTRIGAPIEARDPDVGDTLEYDLAGTDKASFAIDNTGQLTTEGELDYEADRNEDESHTSADYTYEVTIVATDPGRPDETPKGPKLSATFPVTITVTNVNEAPMFPEASDGVYVYEGLAGQEVIDSKEVLTAKDEDINDSFTYRLDVNSGQFFAIDPTTGVLTTKVELDFEGVHSRGCIPLRYTPPMLEARHPQRRSPSTSRT